MKRILIGAFLALILQVGFAPAAQAAAEIPPTAKCVNASAKAFKTYFKEISGDRSQDEEDAAERKLVEGLAAESCISDAEPLLVETETKPYSVECRAAAVASEKFWRPGTRKLRAIERAGDRYDRKIGKRARLLKKKINRLERKGANKHRIARLGARRFNLIVKKVQRKVSDFARVDRTAGKQAFASTLIVYELLSRRCLPFDFDLDDSRGKGPVFKVVHRNEPFIYAALVHIVLRYTDFELDTAAVNDAENRDFAYKGRYAAGIRSLIGTGKSE